jgi:hypothetical protein
LRFTQLQIHIQTGGTKETAAVKPLETQAFKPSEEDCHNCHNRRNAKIEKQTSPQITLMN